MAALLGKHWPGRPASTVRPGLRPTRAAGPTRARTAGWFRRAPPVLSALRASLEGASAPKQGLELERGGQGSVHTGFFWIK